MTPDEREATLERVTDIFLLSLETLAENFAAVVAGEKRIGVAKRTIKKREVWELRLTTPPPVVREPEPKMNVSVSVAVPKAAFDPAELAELADNIGNTPPPAIPDDDPEFDSDVGDTCCAGGPFLGHAADCPLRRTDEQSATEKHLESIMSTVPDWSTEHLAEDTFDPQSGRYRK